MHWSVIVPVIFFFFLESGLPVLIRAAVSNCIVIVYLRNYIVNVDRILPYKIFRITEDSQDTKALTKVT